MDQKHLDWKADNLS